MMCQIMLNDQKVAPGETMALEAPAKNVVDIWDTGNAHQSDKNCWAVPKSFRHRHSYTPAN